jgi:hypothetical protein
MSTPFWPQSLAVASDVTLVSNAYNVNTLQRTSLAILLIRCSPFTETSVWLDSTSAYCFIGPVFRSQLDDLLFITRFFVAFRSVGTYTVWRSLDTQCLTSEGSCQGHSCHSVYRRVLCVILGQLLAIHCQLHYSLLFLTFNAI